MKLFKPKYRIVVYQDFTGKTWYKPQIKQHIFDTWSWYKDKNYCESYIIKDDAINEIEEWKLLKLKNKFKNKSIEIIKL